MQDVRITAGIMAHSGAVGKSRRFPPAFLISRLGFYRHSILHTVIPDCAGIWPHRMDSGSRRSTASIPNHLRRVVKLPVIRYSKRARIMDFAPIRWPASATAWTSISMLLVYPCARRASRFNLLRSHAYGDKSGRPSVSGVTAIPSRQISRLAPRRPSPARRAACSAADARWRSGLLPATYMARPGAGTACTGRR